MLRFETCIINRIVELLVFSLLVVVNYLCEMFLSLAFGMKCIYNFGTGGWNVSNLVVFP